MAMSWRLYPSRRVFIDGRNEINPQLLRELAAARNDSRRWNDLLARFDIDVALVRYDDRLREVLTPGRAPDGTHAVTYHTTNALLFPVSRFALVYWDDQAMMFVRRTPERASWLARDEYRFVHPENRRATLERAATDADFLRRALVELQRRLAEDPRCERALALREELDALTRRTPHAEVRYVR